MIHGNYLLDQETLSRAVPYVTAVKVSAYNLTIKIS